MPAIETHNLATGYDSPLYRGLNFTLGQGELVCLLGLNGAGKSTLLKTLCGFLPPLDGEMRIMGNVVKASLTVQRQKTGFRPEDLSKVMGIVLTDKISAGGVTVRELVSMGRYPHTGFFGRLTDDDLRIVDKSLEAVGMEALQGKQLAELSDGERQKAFIAKALAQECPIIILDEPTAFLDITSRMEMMVMLRHLADREHKAILVSTHDLDTALQSAHTLWLMDKGHGDAGAGGSVAAESGTVRCGTPDGLTDDGTLEAFFSRSSLRFDPSTRRLTVTL